MPLATRTNGTAYAQWSETGDLVLHFAIPELRAAAALTVGTTQLTLTGTLADGRAVKATAPVTTR